MRDQRYVSLRLENPEVCSMGFHSRVALPGRRIITTISIIFISIIIIVIIICAIIMSGVMIIIVIIIV